MTALDPTIDRCTCGDWRANGWCWTCWHWAVARHEVIAANIARNEQLRKEAS